MLALKFAAGVAEKSKDHRRDEEIKGLSLAAIATETVLPSELTEIGRMMVRRFPQISAIQPSEAAPVKLFRVRPTIISVLDYSLGFGHTDLVKIEADDLAETLDSMRHP